MRHLILAAFLVASPAMAQTPAEIEATEGFIRAAFARIYCGIVIPDIVELELNQIADGNGWNRREFAEAIVLFAGEKGRNMTVAQRDSQCTLTLQAYRDLGLQR